MELFSASLRDIAEGGLACCANFKAVYISYVSSAEKKLPHLLLCSFFRWLQFRSKVKDGSKFWQTRVVHGNVAVVNLTAIKSLDLNFSFTHEKGCFCHHGQ